MINNNNGNDNIYIEICFATIDFDSQIHDRKSSGLYFFLVASFFAIQLVVPACIGLGRLTRACQGQLFLFHTFPYVVALLIAGLKSRHVHRDLRAP